jgi:hypothetical protein
MPHQQQRPPRTAPRQAGNQIRAVRLERIPLERNAFAAQHVFQVLHDLRLAARRIRRVDPEYGQEMLHRFPLDRGPVRLRPRLRRNRHARQHEQREQGEANGRE